VEGGEGITEGDRKIEGGGKMIVEQELKVVLCT
jgi:hypothetical protein